MPAPNQAAVDPRPTGMFVGLSTLDVIQLVERLPAPDEKVAARDSVIASGGPATNAAVAFAALGGHAVLVTRTSDDPASELVRHDLRRCGVELVEIPAPGTSTTYASILITEQSGDRAVVSAADQGRSKSSFTDAEGLARALSAFASLQPDVVLVDSYEIDISIPIVERANAAGVPVLLDCGGKKPYTEKQLPGIDVAVVSNTYLPGGAAAIVDDIRQFDVRFGAITSGSDAIEFWCPGTSLAELPVRPVNPVLDTLGAGDFFHGGLAYHLARRGLSAAGFASALQFATEVAGLSIREFGSRSWLQRVGDLVVESR